MVGLFIFLSGLFVTLGMCVLAAKSDFKGFKIPNIVSVVILAAFAVVFGSLTLIDKADVFFKPIGMHVGSGLLVLMVSGAMFALKKLGAGDSKFATAIAVWVGLPGLIPFLFYMSMAGGVIAAISLYLQKNKPFANVAEGTWIDVVQKGGGSVPYGIAIAVGALASFIYIGFFNLERWVSMF